MQRCHTKRNTTNGDPLETLLVHPVGHTSKLQQKCCSNRATVLYLFVPVAWRIEHRGVACELQLAALTLGFCYTSCHADCPAAQQSFTPCGFTGEHLGLVGERSIRTRMIADWKFAAFHPPHRISRRPFWLWRERKLFECPLEPIFTRQAWIQRLLKLLSRKRPRVRETYLPYRSRKDHSRHIFHRQRRQPRRQQDCHSPSANTAGTEADSHVLNPS